MALSILALWCERSPKHDPREIHSHGAPVHDRLETDPIGRVGIANAKLPIATRNELLNAIEKELAFTQHDPCVAIPRTVVIVVTGKSFPLLFRFERFRSAVFSA